MTNGSIVKGVTRFAIPCILARVIQNIYPLLDSLIVGKILNLESLSAVGIAGSLYALFNDTLVGLVAGFAIIVSKKYGAEKKKEVAEGFYNALTLSLVLCGVASVLGIVFSDGMLTLLRTPAALMDCAKEYIVVMLLGLIPNMLYNFISEMLRAVGNSKMPLYLLVVSSVVHLALLYPLTLAFGVRGTALANIVSYVVTVVFGAIYIKKKVPAFRKEDKLCLDTNTMRECMSIGMPMSLTNLVVMLGVLMLSFVTNTIGTEYVAAYSCASKIGYIVTTPIFGFATALAVFVSQNYGAENYDRIKQGIRSTLFVVYGVNIAIAAAVFALLKPMLNFMLDGNAVAVKAGCLYLLIRCVSMLVLTPAAIYKSILPAIGKPFFSTLSGFMEIGARFMFPLLLSQTLGFSVVPLTDTFTWCLLTALLVPAYYYEFKKIMKKRGVI